MSSAQSGRIRLLAVAALGAAVVGIGVASVSPLILLSMVIIVVGVLALVAVRAVVRPVDVRLVPSRESEFEVAAASDVTFEVRAFRPARMVYYLGAATIGLLTVRPALGFTASDLIFLGALGITVVVIVVERLALPFLVPRSITIGVFMFALGGLLSSLEAVHPYGSAMIVVRMLYLTLIWFWLGTVVLQTRSHVETALAAWVSSAALSSSGAILQFFYGDVIPGGIVNYGRMSGFTTQLNVLGGLAATALVPALMLAIDSPRPRMRILGICSSGLITAGLLLSGSVGGLLAASGATVLWLVLRGIGLRIVVALGAVVAVGFVLMTATGTTDSPSPVNRILNVTSREEAQTGRGGTVYSRLEGFSDAWARIQKQPLIGVGLDYDSTVAVTPKAVHNMILGPWLTAGILGVVGLMVIVGGSIATGIRVLRRSSPEFRSFDAATFAALMAFVQFSMGEPILYVRYGWFPTALLLALWAQQVRAGASGREAAVRHDRLSPWAAHGATRAAKGENATIQGLKT